MCVAASLAVFSHVLLVEPDAVFGSSLQQAVSDVADIQCVSDFAAARSVLQQSPVDLLVTNLRLGAFNGLHLVYLAQFVARGTRAVVYTDWLDTGLGRDVQRAGAFYETRPCLPYTLIWLSSVNWADLSRLTVVSSLSQHARSVLFVLQIRLVGGITF